MKGKQHLTRSEDFDRVYRHKASWASPLLVLRAAENRQDYSRYGFSVSKKVGKAVVRNLTRRRLREIVRRANLKPGWDVVFIVRAPAAVVRFDELSRAVDNLLVRAKLLDRKTDETPGVGAH